MTATADQLATNVSRAVLLSFSGGDSSTAYFAKHDEDITYDSNDYIATPEMEFNPLRRTGSLEPETLEITAPNDNPPFDTLSAYRKHATVSCTVGVCNPDDAAGTYREVFYGKIGACERIDADDDSLWKFDLRGIKARLNAKLGFYADNYCQVHLGHTLCGIDIAAQRETATVTEIGTDNRGNRITVSWSGGTPDLTDARWRTGALIWNGLVLNILESVGSSKFDLELDPPSAMDGQTVTMEPGCDGTLSTCRNVWANELNFVGFGLDMQDRYPLTEVG